MKKKLPPNTSRLFFTEDRDHEDVWFARTEAEQFARLKMSDMWEIYFYPQRFTVRKGSLKESIELIEKLFKKYWRYTYGNSRV